MSYRTGATVLLIESDASLRRLIALGLHYRGIHVIEAASPQYMLDIEAEPPDLLILDIDGRMSSDHSQLTIIQADPYLSTLPTILLGWECPAAIPAGGAHEHHSAVDAHVTYLAKPFDARALQTTIEQLLADRSLQQTVQTRGVLAPALAASSTPSIWPFITAAGLLLTFIGLLGLLAFTAIGLCIVVVSLLWWTIGAAPQKEPAPPLSVGIGHS